MATGPLEAMLSSWIKSPGLAEEPHRRGGLPYAVFISGIVLGVMVSAAAGLPGGAELGADEAGLKASAPSSSGVPEESNAGALRIGSPRLDWSALRVTYYVVDSATPASVLAKAISSHASDRPHVDFVIVGDEDKSEEIPGMRIAMHELSQSGALVQMVDLR